MNKSLIGILIISCFLNFSYGQNSERIDSYYQSLLSNDEAKPVTALLVRLENGKTGTIIHKGFGSNSLSDTASVLPDSPYKTASVTKMFTATLILQLIEQHKLQLTDKISELLSDQSYINFNQLHIYKGKPYAHEITIEQLLNHTSGLADIFSDTEEAFIQLFMSNPTKQWNTEDLFNTYYNFGLNTQAHFKPGDDYYYSDTNYFLLGLLIEKLTRTSLAEAYRSYIIEPAGLKHTFFEYHEASTNDIRMFSTYLQDIELTADLNTSFDWAGGGLVSTTTDLSLFMKALFDGQLIKGKVLFQKMLFNSGSRYGYGIFIYNINGHNFYGHSGYWGNMVCHDPERELTLAVSVNQSDPGFSFNELIKKSLKFIE